MDGTLLEIREYTGEGFMPLMCSGAWRVAILNYMDSLHPDRVQDLERHAETDEVFVLLRGQALLFIGEGEPQVQELTSQIMEVGKIYDVKPLTWHTIVMSEAASLLIIENRDTGPENSQTTGLLPEHRLRIQEIARREYPDCWK